MTEISGFTFIHNALNGGYPIVEAIYSVLPYVEDMVVVDMESTDGTAVLLEYMAVKHDKIRIIPGLWEAGAAGLCLRVAHAVHKFCNHEVIVHFEADEVFSPALMRKVIEHIERDEVMLNVPRIQVEQNFQRVRWYPGENCNRVFYRGSVIKQGHTTDAHEEAINISPDWGAYLWDVTNCFRDHWTARVEQQAELWGERPHYRHVPRHFLSAGTDVACVEDFLNEDQWTWTSTPLDLPPILRSLVGQTTYDPYRLIDAVDHNSFFVDPKNFLSEGWLCLP